MSVSTTLAPAVITGAFCKGRIIEWDACGDPRRDGSTTARNTVFRIASMSKSFLAAAALALREEGRLDFDCSIAHYVPGVKFELNGEEQTVTIGELLANRSGMPEDNAWGDRQLGASRESIHALACAGLQLTARPGERYQYSNLGMSLVGRAIEAVTARTVEEVVRWRFFEPLGLSHTRYRVDEYPEGTHIANGYRSFDADESFHLEPFVGSGALACIGGIFSTIDDIAVWAWFLASAFGDDPVQPALLSPRSRREMQRAHTPIPIESIHTESTHTESIHTERPTSGRDLSALGYGLGLVVEHDRRFGTIVSHSGGLPGFSSHMRWHLASGTGAVVFGNSDAFTAEHLAVSALAKRLESIPVDPTPFPVWQATLSAAERIDRVLRDGASISEAADVCAGNLLLDVPAEIRDLQLGELLEDSGGFGAQRPFTERLLTTADAAHVKWHLDCERSPLVCEIRLVGLNPPMVQSLKVVKASP